MKSYEILTHDGTFTDSPDPDADDADRVTVTLGDGELVEHGTAGGLGGVTYEIVGNAVLLIRGGRDGEDVFRAYGPHGWHSVTGKAHGTSSRRAGY